MKTLCDILGPRLKEKNVLQCCVKQTKICCVKVLCKRNECCVTVLYKINECLVAVLCKGINAVKKVINSVWQCWVKENNVVLQCCVRNKFCDLCKKEQILCKRAF